MSRLRIRGIVPKILLIHLVISGWIQVVRFIPIDLESTPLQIKTNSNTGSWDRISVKTYTADGSSIGWVTVRFFSPMQYKIGYCTSRTILPVQPPDVLDKKWTIMKTNTTLGIECNGVEVLNYQFSDSSNSYCASRWGRNEVETIRFSSSDNASDSYQKKKEGILTVIFITGTYPNTSTHTVELNC